MSSLSDSFVIKIWEKLRRSPLFRDSVWSLAGSIVGRGLSLVAGILVARFLGREIYGEFGLIKTTLIYIEIFSTFGLGYTATKFLADSKEKNVSRVYPICKATLRITLFTSGFMALIVLLLAEKISILINAPQLHNTLRITAIGIVLNAINIAQIGILSGFGEFKTIAKNTTISGVITFIVTVILTYFWGLNGAVTALVLTYGTQCIVNNISVRYKKRQYEQFAHSDKCLYKELLSFSFPIALQESMYSLINWLISFMLIKTSGYGELGLYSAAAQWGAIISFIPGILRNVTLSHLSGNATNQKAHKRTMWAMLMVSFTSTSVMFLLVFLLQKQICSFYGNTFDGLRYVLFSQTLCAIVVSTSNVYVQEFMSRGKNWEILLCKIIRDGGALLTAYNLILLIKNRGAMILSLSLLAMNILYLIALAFIYRIHQRSQKDEN